MFLTLKLFLITNPIYLIHICRVERDAIHSMIKANKDLYNLKAKDKFIKEKDSVIQMREEVKEWIKQAGKDLKTS